MREWHTLRPPLTQPPLNRDWQAFIERQARTSVERQRACSANPEWLESLPAYIAARQELLPTSYSPVLLHGDVHAGNLLLEERGGRWQIAGLIDFGDSFCGFHAYEFVAPGVLMVQGDRELQRAMLLAYGYTEAQLDIDLRARLMLLTILYEWSDLRKYAERLAPEAVNLTLDELERAIWKFTN
jgi:hygromycin-B 7''-O-kinase